MFSLIYYIYVGTECALLFLVSVIVLPFSLVWDKPRRLIHEISRVITRLFFKTQPFGRYDIRGLENIDRRQAYVMTINHQSMADIIQAYFIPLNFRWVSKREVFKIPFIGRFLLLHGDIAIERGNGSAAMRKVIEQGRVWLGRGVSIAIFPEGTRSKDGEIHRFKNGAFLLAKEAGVPILPVVMDGSTTILKKNYLFNWRNRISLRVLPPVSAEDVAATEVADMAERVHGAMTEALAAMRADNAAK